MQTFIDRGLDIVSKLGVSIITLLVIFLVGNFTTEFYETPKFIALALFVAILLLLWALKSITQGKMSLKVTPLDLPLLLLIVAAVVSTIMSPSHYVSLFGNNTRINGSLISLIVYTLFYFLLVNNFKQLKEVKTIIYLLILSGIVLSIVSLLSYFGIKVLPFSWAQTVDFNPTGSSFSATAILAMFLPFSLLSLLKDPKPQQKLFHIMVLALFGTTIVLIGNLATIAVSVIALILSLLTVNRSNTKNFAILLMPILMIVVVAIISSLPSTSKVKNPFYDKAQNFPREIQLPLDTSWKISVSAFRDSPLFGTGPSTYLFNFTDYKPAEFNNNKFWNVRFDQAFNEYLMNLANLGSIGLILFLSLTFLYLKSASRVINNKTSEDYINQALGIAGILFFCLLALHPSSLVVWVIGLLIIALFMSTNETLTKTLHLKLGTIRYSESQLVFDALPIIVLGLILILIGSGFFYIGKFAISDYHHRLALNAVAKNQAIDAYNQLVLAENLSPENDLTRTDLAQTNFAIANALAVSKGPSEASPGGSLTDQDKQNIQQLIQQAISEGRAATTLSPRSAGNFEILGSIYRQVSGVAQSALDFALDAYGRAIQHDPYNPNLRILVGGIYYSVKNYDSAIRLFTDAINLKPDLGNAYYNLSVTLRDKGDLKTAQTVAEKLLTVVDPKSKDYQVAADYLADLKARIATGSAEQSPIKAPAAQSSGPLQQKQLPQIDLPKPESIATPTAVQK